MWKNTPHLRVMAARDALAQRESKSVRARKKFIDDLSKNPALRIPLTRNERRLQAKALRKGKGGQP